jgi:hypothetical protein
MKETKLWSKGLFKNGDGIKTPKITVNKSEEYSEVIYQGPETGFSLESAVYNPNDTIHQMSNVFTYETNKHLTDLYNSGVYLKPKMDQIEFEKKSKYFRIKVYFEKTDEVNSILKINRRGGMGHPATSGKKEMIEKCSEYLGCDKVYTYKSGSITEYFICYKNSSIKKPKTEIQIFKVGSEGDMVKKIQKSLGFEDKNCDGKFGLKTEQKVKEFQKKNEMNPDGIVGPQTLKKLNII